MFDDRLFHHYYFIALRKPSKYFKFLNTIKQKKIKIDTFDHHIIRLSGISRHQVGVLYDSHAKLVPDHHTIRRVIPLHVSHPIFISIMTVQNMDGRDSLCYAAI